MKKDYSYDIVNGTVPDQESFTKEEVRNIMMTVAVWAKVQMDEAIKSLRHEDDMEEYIAMCEIDATPEAVKDIEDFWTDELLSTTSWLVENFE